MLVYDVLKDGQNIGRFAEASGHPATMINTVTEMLEAGITFQLVVEPSEDGERFKLFQV